MKKVDKKVGGFSFLPRPLFLDMNVVAQWLLIFGLIMYVFCVFDRELFEIMDDFYSLFVSHHVSSCLVCEKG